MKKRQVDMTGGYCKKARRKVGNPDIRCPLAKKRNDVSCSPVCGYWDSVMPKQRQAVTVFGSVKSVVKKWMSLPTIGASER